MMKKNIIKTEEIYILRRPTRAFLAIIGLGIYPPITEVYEALEEIKKAGFDLFFVMGEQEIKEQKINPSKFTSLSEGIGFMVYNSTKGSAHSFLDVYKYVTKTIPKYVGVTWAGEKELRVVKPEEIEAAGKTWITLGTSGSLPALEIEKRDREELYNEAQEDEVLVEEERGFFGKVNFEEWGWEMLGEGSWNVYTSNTILPYLPKTFYPILSKAIDEKEEVEIPAMIQDDWKETWRGSNEPMNLIASAIRQFGLEYLDRSPGKIELNPAPSPVFPIPETPKKKTSRGKKTEKMETKGV